MTLSSNLASAGSLTNNGSAPVPAEGALTVPTLAVVLVVSIATLAVMAKTGGSITVASIGLAVTVNAPR